MLDDVATALEDLVSGVVAMMNAGATLDTIVHTVKVPADTLAKPYLRPLYDEPEFVVRGIWRQFGGWWDGAASRLKPSPDAAGRRPRSPTSPVAPRCCCAAPSRPRATATCAWPVTSPISPAGRHPTIRRSTPVARRSTSQRRKVEPSLMSKGIFAAAARESQQVVDAGTATDG